MKNLSMANCYLASHAFRRNDAKARMFIHVTCYKARRVCHSF
jgi:hypothetical protein